MPTKKKAPGKTLVALASLISTTLLVVRLWYHGFIGPELAAGLLIGVVAFMAIGKSFAKLLLALFALAGFSQLLAHEQGVSFADVFQGIIAIVIVLTTLYLILRGIFR